MHFSIPDTADADEKTSGSAFTVFNIHINGVYHCSVRYKLFHSFYEQLKKEFGADTLPPFPPKKLLTLSPSQLEERRSVLERFIQIVSQNQQISGSEAFNNFLLAAQQHSQNETPEDATMDVYLMNGQKVSVNIVSTDQTNDVLETVSSKIELSDDYVYYFGLFLVKKENNGDTAIVRKLQEFESPYISLKAANKTGSNRIVIRKTFWDSTFDDDLIDDRVAMNLLHVQTVSDIERKWVLASSDEQKQLDKLIQRNSKKEFLRYARTLKYYGHIQFKPCISDYPEPNCKAIVSAGNRELNFRVQVPKGNKKEIKEISFKVTRMRCWRITSVYPEVNGEGSEQCSSTDNKTYAKLELSFEYLMCKDTLQWITVVSDQAILMSMSLQGMVDELIMKKQGKRFKKPQDRENSRRRKQSTTTSVTTQSYKTPNGRLKSQSSVSERHASGSSYKRSVSTLSTSSYLSGGALTENEAFSREGGIGDDDL